MESTIGGALTSLDVAKKIARFAFDKKAEDIVVMSMSGVVNYCDYFVICSATSSRHVRAVADVIDEGLHAFGIKVKFRQGLGASSGAGPAFLGSLPSPQDVAGGCWGLLDMGDVVVHIFEPGSRAFYGLDYLWKEAEKVEWR